MVWNFHIAISLIPTNPSFLQISITKGKDKRKTIFRHLHHVTSRNSQCYDYLTLFRRNRHLQTSRYCQISKLFSSPLQKVTSFTKSVRVSKSSLSFFVVILMPFISFFQCKYGIKLKVEDAITKMKWSRVRTSEGRFSYQGRVFYVV